MGISKSSDIPLRKVKLERYLFLGEKLSRAIEKIALGVRPGDAECEIAGRLAAELWKDRIDPTGFQVAADERALLYRHPIPTTRLINKYVMICANARYKGLITTITRIVHIGKPDPQLIRQFTFNCEIECRMILATKPGIPISVPFQAGLEAYKEFGYEGEWERHNQGGAQGYLARDIRAVPDAKDLIEENQAICWNPFDHGNEDRGCFHCHQGWTPDDHPSGDLSDHCLSQEGCTSDKTGNDDFGLRNGMLETGSGHYPPIPTFYF